MNTILVKILDRKAIKLLRELNDLGTITILNENLSLSMKYVGSISKEEGEKLNKHIEDSRNEWDSL